MKSSKHAKKRSSQRGISQEMQLLVWLFGTPVEKPGGAKELRIDKRGCQLVVARLKKMVHDVERISGIGVLVNEDETIIITTYPLR